MPDRNRQLGASTTAPTLAPPCTECQGFNVPALVRGNWQRGTCHACGGAGTAEAQQDRSAAQVACATDGDFGHVVEPAPAEATMFAIDETAVRAGHRLPADSMVFRPDLADEVLGTAWEWRPGESAYLVDINVSWSLDATLALIRALKQVMSREQAADALARILRVHGADVREVRS